MKELDLLLAKYEEGNMSLKELRTALEQLINSNTKQVLESIIEAADGEYPEYHLDLVKDKLNEL